MRNEISRMRARAAVLNSGGLHSTPGGRGRSCDRRFVLLAVIAMAAALGCGGAPAGGWTCDDPMHKCHQPEIVPSCKTTCGFEMFNDSSCSELQTAEDRVLHGFADARVTSANGAVWTYDQECDAVSKGRLYIYAQAATDGTWVDPVGGTVSGSTMPGQGGTIVSWLAPGQLRYTVFAHEMAHEISDEISGIEPVPHQDWDKRGLWAAIGATSPND